METVEVRWKIPLNLPLAKGALIFSSNVLKSRYHGLCGNVVADALRPVSIEGE